MVFGFGKKKKKSKRRRGIFEGVEGRKRRREVRMNLEKKGLRKPRLKG